MFSNYDFGKLVDRYVEYCGDSGRIDQGLYKTYDVKQGLRDADGRGVLTGLTEISDVQGFKREGDKRVPIPGELYYQGYNVQEVVLDMRTGNGMYDRRGGRNYLIWAVRFQKCLLHRHFISRNRFIRDCAVRLAVGIIPGGAREKFYHIFLRNAK